MLIRVKTKIMILNKKLLEIGKKLIFLKFPLLRAKNKNNQLLKWNLKYIDGEDNGNNGTFFIYCLEELAN
jgi:hypothetical protein